MQEKRGYFGLVLIALVIVSASFAGGAVFGYNSRPDIEKVFGVQHQEPGLEVKKVVDFAPFWKAWRLLEEKHVSDDDFDRQKLLWGAIQGMTASLGDPYTVFFPPKDNEDFKSEIKGEFSGIGAEIGVRKGVLTVIAPLKGSPAEAAGLKPGDKVLKIGDKFTNDLSLDDAIHLIRGEKGTKVQLTVLQNGQDKPKVVTVTRDTIRVPVIETEKKANGIFLIRLSTFSENSALEFKKAMRDFMNSGDKKLILDLRGNPGGYFDAAVDIAGWFLPEGDVVAKEAYQGKDPISYRSSGLGYDTLGDVPMVILVNQGSASASEILSGALQEHKKAVLIGERTFGKGTVQELESITDNTSIKITVAKWLTPSGKSISKEGLTPDIEVKIPENLKPGEDPQMDKAIEYLKSK